MKEYIWWIITSALALIVPVQEYIITCEVLIILNWIADKYVQKRYRKKHKKRKIPVYIQLFFVTTTICVARWIDDIFLKSYTTSYNLSLGLVLFELATFYKNISIILGIDINKLIKFKK